MGSLADCVLADAILIPPHPLILPPTTIKKVRGHVKSMETSTVVPLLRDPPGKRPPLI